MRKILAICLALAVLGFGLSKVVAGDPPKDGAKTDAKNEEKKDAKAEDKDEDCKKNPKAGLPVCIIMNDEAANLFVHTDTKDGPVYFCCAHCIDKYKKDPAKYAKEVEAQRAVLAKMKKVQVCCPFSHKEIDPKATVDYKGEKVAFCCNDCADKFKKDPEKYADKLAGAYTYQTVCPVGGEKIDPKVSLELKHGGKVYFCCEKCVKTFEKDPAKYAEKLEAQGYHVRAADVKKS